MNDAERTAVYGASGEGKTTFTRQRLTTSGRVVVYDTEAEYCDLPGFARVTTVAAVRDHLADHWRRGFRVVYQVPPGHEPEMLDRLSRLLLLAQKPYFRREKGAEQILFGVDEVNKGYPVTQLPAGLWGFGEICSRGRKHGIEVWGVSQRVAEVNTRWRGNTTRSYFFRAADHADAKTACRMLKPANYDRLMGLGIGEYLMFERGHVTAGRHRLKKSLKA